MDRMKAITVDDVRHAAWKSSKVWNEVYHKADISVVSFDNPEFETRLDVYYKTGTVASILEHRNRECSKHMRFNLDLAGIADLFENPRTPTGLKYHDEGGKGLESEEIDDKKSWYRGSREDQIEMVKAELKKMYLHHASITTRLSDNDIQNHAGESETGNQDCGEDVRYFKNQVQDVVAVEALGRLEDVRKLKPDGESGPGDGGDSAECGTSQAYPTSSSKPDMSSNPAGDGFGSENVSREMTFLLSTDMGDFLDDIDPATTHLFAGVSDDGLLVVSDDGLSRWKGRIPLELEIALESRSCAHCLPHAISLGTNDRFYIKFANGSHLYSAQNGLEEEMCANATSVRMVAFGESKDSFAILRNDGSVTCRNLPVEIAKALTLHNKRIRFLSLGPSGEYFARCQDGSHVVGGLDSIKLEYLNQIVGNLREVVFGGPNIFIRHEMRCSTRGLSNVIAKRVIKLEDTQAQHLSGNCDNGNN